MEEKTAQAKSDLAQKASLPASQPAALETQDPSLPAKRNKPFWIVAVGIFVALLIVGIIVGWHLWTNYVKTQKVYHVGIVSGMEGFATIADGFQKRMTELGYVKDKNITYDLHKLDADPVGVKKAIKKFVEDKVDLILAFSTGAAVEAKSATKGTDIPVVFAVATTEKSNLIDSVREPGGNITGIRYPLQENTAGRLEMLHSIVPDAKRIYLIYDINYSNTKVALDVLHSKAASFGITFVEDPVSNLEELKAVLKKRDAMANIGIDAILIMPDVLSNSSDGASEIIAFANKHKLPVGGCTNNTANSGALFSFFPDNINQGMLAADSADKIFKGIPAGTIPVVTPEFYLRINYKAFQQLNLNAREGLLIRASEIIR
jgi:putative tryptophan/tyrosine transport system substrate-binding protein